MVTRQEASLEDFRAFHGMFSNPWRSQRCIRSFDGRILFQPKDYDDKRLEQYDYSTRFRLNLFSYYFLVLASWTGFSSLIGRTKCLVARDEHIILSGQPLESTSHPQLVVRPSVWEYLLGSAASSNTLVSSPLVLKRRFEFEFGGYIKVVMLHVWNQQAQTLSLVEVIETESVLLQCVAESLQRILGYFRLSTKQKSSYRSGGWK